MNDGKDWMNVLEMNLHPKNREQVFNEIWKRHYKAVYFYLSRNRGITHEQCEDLTQECFLKAYRSLESYNRNYSLKTWLFSIARNLSIDYFRKDSRSPEQIAFDSVSDPGTMNSPESLFFVSEEKQQWQDYLESRPIEIQQILFLRLEQKLSYREIAGITEKPEGTIRSLVHHEKKKAEFALKEDYYGPMETILQKQNG